MDRQDQRRRFREEVWNSVTHGTGALLSVAALVILVLYAVWSADPWRIVGASIFGASLVFLYVASTLYHAIPNARAKRILHSLDHVGIYLLIAGTYTPFLLVSLRGPWGWSLFGFMWGAALLGCVFKIFFVGRWKKASTLLYVAMGWTVVIAIKPALAAVPGWALLFALIGGLFYTAGAGFYLWRRLPYHHAIWHCFVLAGSASHFFAVYRIIGP